MDEKMKELDALFDFFREIDKEKLIERKTYVTGAVRWENDAEHAWHMALMTVLLSEYSNEPIDVLKTVTMLLIHDLVEIDAGDTYAYSGVSKEEQHAKEEKGAARIFGMLPKEKGRKLYDLWQEFEAGETAEARFAHAMDNIQPMMLNDYTDGKAWQQFGVSLSKIYKRNELRRRAPASFGAMRRRGSLRRMWLREGSGTNEKPPVRGIGRGRQHTLLESVLYL